MSDAKWLSGSSARDGLRDLLSGMVSGFVCKIVEYPADTIKARADLQSKCLSIDSLGPCFNYPHLAPVRLTSALKTQPAGARADWRQPLQRTNRLLL